MGVSPGRDTGCAESVSTPGETIDARKVCVPRARLEMRGRRVFPGRDDILCGLDYYCIRLA